MLAYSCIMLAHACTKICTEFLAKEHWKWTKTFPLEFTRKSIVFVVGYPSRGTLRAQASKRGLDRAYPRLGETMQFPLTGGKANKPI
jgi:hypothetical protein